MIYDTHTCATILDARYGLYMAWFCNQYDDQQDAECYILPIAGYLPKNLRFPQPLTRAAGSILIIEHGLGLPPMDIRLHISMFAGEFVRNWRIARGMRQVDFARAAKIDRSYLNQLEGGRKSVGWKTWAKLAAYIAAQN